MAAPLIRDHNSTTSGWFNQRTPKPIEEERERFMQHCLRHYWAELNTANPREHVVRQRRRELHRYGVDVR